MKRLSLPAILTACFCLVIISGTGQAEDRKVKPITLTSSAEREAGTNYSSGFLVGNYAEGVLLVSLSGVSGTPTLQVFAQTSDDNSTYYEHGLLATITTSGATAYQITNFGKYLRTKEVLSAATECAVTYEIKGVFKN